MPLQIRRGTQAERDDLVTSYVPLAAGEPLWCTDTGNLYVGDGVTYGGVQANPTPQILLADYTGQFGEIEKDPIGDPGTKSPFITLDGIEATIDLDGQISSHVTPNFNEIFNLGSNNFRYNRLYVSGNGIEIGETRITAANGPWVDLPPGSTVGGVAIEGVVPGATYEINIGAPDSSLLLDYNNSTLRGSVVAIDDTVLVSATLKTLSNGVITLSNNQILSSNPTLNVGTDLNKVNLIMSSDSTSPALQINAAISGSQGITQVGSIIRLASVAGTLTSPDVLAAGDLCGQLQFAGRVNGGTAGIPILADLANIRAVVASPGDLTTTKGSGKLQLYVANQNDPLNSKFAELDINGVFSAPAFKAGVYTSTPVDTRPTPAKGMIIFNDTTGTFQGYNGTAWVDLG